jgi:glycosyltransferase involved in cell wall biosynthesis
VVVTRQWGNTFGSALDYVAPGVSEQVLMEETEFGKVLYCPYHPSLSHRLLLKYGDTRFKMVRKCLSGFYEILQYLLPIGTKRELYIAAFDYLSKNKVDVIIATGEPFVLFHYAKRLSKRFKVPWVADYRDPWSNPWRKKNGLYYKFNQWVEKRTVGSASLISTVSTFVERQIRQQVPMGNFCIAPNGYDEEVLANLHASKQNAEVFQMAFVGTIYDWHPLEIVLKTLNDWAASNPQRKFELHFYGTNCNKEIIQNTTKYFPLLKEVVKVHPKMSNQSLLKCASKHNILLLFNDYAIIGTKIYDYLALKRKIVLCFSNDLGAQVLKEKYYLLETYGASETLQEDLIRATNSGIIVENAAQLLETMNDLYEEHQHTGQIACESSGIEAFSRILQVEQLAEKIKANL